MTALPITGLGVSGAAALRCFRGVRVTYCDSGDIMAIPTDDTVWDGVEKLGKAEATRADCPAFARRMRQAAHAVYGDVIVLRENAETCACNMYFAELRLVRLRPHAGRQDRGN